MIFKSTQKFLELIKFSHTVFALPFTLISAFLALKSTEVIILSKNSGIMLGWIILAMIGARSGAMGFNRLVDLKWDAQNPRTANRPSVTGEVSRSKMLTMILFSFSLLVFAAWNLNFLAFCLSPLAIFLVCFYSLTKRFTHYSHLFLGFAIGSAPVASWIAVTGEISPSSLLIGVSVLIWIAGFDILYALQDVEFDKTTGLHSIPVRFGVSKSLNISRLMHLSTVVCWIVLAQLEQLNVLYYLGVVICSGLLIWEHSLLKKDDLSKLDMAFFNMNAIVSVTMFIALTMDLLVFK